MNLENYFISCFDSKNIGDDGAFIDGYIYSKDAFFEGVHFKKEWLSYYEIAQKAMMVNISDALSMGAKPKYALLSVAMPKSMSKSDAKELSLGFLDSAKKYGVEIIGGDTISNAKLDITITIISKTSKPLFRSTIRQNHLVAYSGILGRSAKELKRLQNLGKIHKNSKFKNIILRDNFIFKSKRYLSGCMDISDGLFSDLNKLSLSSRVGFRFLKKIPQSIGCSGEEYELLFAFDKRYKLPLQRVAKLTRTPITIFAKTIRKNYINRCKAHHF